MNGRALLAGLVVAWPPLAGAGEPVRLDAAALGTIAIDPDEARAAREANERLLDGRLLADPDPRRPRGALLDRLRPSLPAHTRATGPAATGRSTCGQPADE